MAEVIASHHLHCVRPGCKTNVILSVYSCGCRRVKFIDKYDAEEGCTNFTALECNSPDYPDCDSGGSFVSDVAKEVAKKAAVAAIAALIGIPTIS